MEATGAATATAAVTSATTAAVPSGYGNVSLYVGDLEQNVNESQLYDLFSQVAQVVSVRVCRDQSKRSSLGYAYVNYSNPQDDYLCSKNLQNLKWLMFSNAAANAKEALNFMPINGKPIRIMYSHRDPSIRKSGYGNALCDTFAAFGTVLSCKVAIDSNGQSKGYGFVQFENEEAAQNAIKMLNGMLINDKQVYVGLFVRRQERAQQNVSPKFTNVYVNNLAETVTDEDLKKIFGHFGTITSAIVMKDSDGKSRCFGFVNFQSPDAAAAAVEKLNGTTNNDKVWYVGRAQKRAEREADLRAKFEQERISRYEKLKGANLYLKNLDDSINDEKLKELFSEFGTITSCKVMVDQHGFSKGSGFVAFSMLEEATRALNEMNGKMIGRKPLYVAVAQRKEERKARLQAQFAQIRAPGGMSPLASGIPGYHHGAPRLGPQQLYYAAGYGFQQQVFPGLRPGGPNYIMPYHLQRQVHPGQRTGVRRSGNTHQMQQPQVYLDNARNGTDQSVVSMVPVPFEVSGMPATPVETPRPVPVPISTLTSALASASPDDRTRMLGEQLYPLVENIEPVHASKVTGMLLEMDQTEVLHLIESPEALKTKVAEAMAVLQEAAARSDVNEKLGSLAVNE
ncbi:polyadenylate-binding protein [Citrus sinensis]|nr:polyadenylate-binding protein [Citrus sinensis]